MTENFEGAEDRHLLCPPQAPDGLILGHLLVHSVDKTYVLILTVEWIWLLLLNILSFNFFLRLTVAVLSKQ